jgi:hypothetical protein
VPRGPDGRVGELSADCALRDCKQQQAAASSKASGDDACPGALRGLRTEGLLFAGLTDRPGNHTHCSCKGGGGGGGGLGGGNNHTEPPK